MNRRNNRVLPNKEMKLIKYTVGQNSTLFDFLIQLFPGKSRNSIKQLLSKGHIQIHNEVVTQFDYPLVIDQVVYISNVPINIKEDTYIDILFEDEHLLIINKPNGLLSMASAKEKEKTAYHLVRAYLQKKAHRAKVFIVHRLDKDTSGVLLFAKNDTVKYILQNNWNELVTKRGYTAIVEGHLHKNEGTIRNYLMETKTQLVYSSRDSKEGKLAITHYRVLNQNQNYTLLDISLETGRKNQIRVHMQDIGHPIIGDKKYGARTSPINRLGLHAHALEFNHPITKEKIKVKTKIPSEFIKLLSR